MDSSASVLLTQTFDPYGNLYASAGTASSSYGYTGEQTDANGLLFLRARYYAPSMGRFLNMDPSRQEKNPYQYSLSNPVMFVDPSGLEIEDPKTPSSTEAADAFEIIQDLESDYNVKPKVDFGWSLQTTTTLFGITIPLFYEYGKWDFLTLPCSGWVGGNWDVDELELLLESVELIESRLGSSAKFGAAMGRTTINRKVSTVFGIANALVPGTIALSDDFFTQQLIPGTTLDETIIYWTVHEFGHRWDWNEGLNLSGGLRQELKDRDFTYVNLQACISGYGNCEKQLKEYFTDYSDNPWQLKNKEDWAEVFAGYIVGHTSDGTSNKFTFQEYPARYLYVVGKINAL